MGELQRTLAVPKEGAKKAGVGPGSVVMLLCATLKSGTARPFFICTHPKEKPPRKGGKRTYTLLVEGRRSTSGQEKTAIRAAQVSCFRWGESPRCYLLCTWGSRLWTKSPKNHLNFSEYPPSAAAFLNFFIIRYLVLVTDSGSRSSMYGISASSTSGCNKSS